MNWNKIFDSVLNPIPIKNKQWKIIINQVVFPIFIVSLLYSYHFILFSTKIKKNSVTVYYNDSKSTSEINTIIDSSLIILKRKNINVNGNSTVFFSDDQSSYNWCTLNLRKGSVGLTLPVVNRIIINGAPLKYRTYADVIAHELVHVYQNQTYGFIKLYSTPDWIKEGYCEYIAGNCPISNAEGSAIFLDKIKEKAVVEKKDTYTYYYLYFKYKLMVTYLLDKKGLTETELFQSDLNFETIVAEIRATY